MSAQTPAGGSEPSVLPPAGLPPIDPDAAFQLANDAIGLFLEYRAARPDWTEEFTRNAAAGDAAEAASPDLPHDPEGTEA